MPQLEESIRQLAEELARAVIDAVRGATIGEISGMEGSHALVQGISGRRRLVVVDPPGDRRERPRLSRNPPPRSTMPWTGSSSYSKLTRGVCALRIFARSFASRRGDGPTIQKSVEANANGAGGAEP
jgi:hypothetical protein